MELASKYGICMIDSNGNKLENIDDYGKCYMIIVQEPEKFVPIPTEFMTYECSCFNGLDMPIFDIEDDSIRLADWSHKPLVFTCEFDNYHEELYWRDITFDYSIIAKLIGQ